MRARLRAVQALLAHWPAVGGTRYFRGRRAFWERHPGGPRAERAE